MAWDQFADFLDLSGWVKWSLPWAAAGLVCLLRERTDADRKFILSTLLGFSAAGLCRGILFQRTLFHRDASRRQPVDRDTVSGGAGAGRGAAGGGASGPAALFVAGLRGFCLQPSRCLVSNDHRKRFAERMYGGNPFVESVEIGQYIREHSAPDARIAVFGSEPQIYFYAHRRSASGFIYMYDLVQLNHYAGQFQREMIAEIEAARPQFLVMVMRFHSWLIRPGADKTLNDWSDATICTSSMNGLGSVVYLPNPCDYDLGKRQPGMKKTILTF